MENNAAFNWKNGLTNEQIKHVGIMNYVLTRMKRPPTSISSKNVENIKSTKNISIRQKLIENKHKMLKNEMTRRTQEIGPKFTDEQRKILQSLQPNEKKKIILTNNKEKRLRSHNEIVRLLEEVKQRRESTSGGKKSSVKKLKEKSVKKKKISKK